MKKVVIIGGGFGGLQAARALGKTCGGEHYHVTLLDQRNFHTFQPLLYQLATGALTTGDIATPYRAVLRNRPNVHPLMSTAVDVDLQRQEVIHTQGRVPYDELIVATGGGHAYFGREDWREHAPGLKTIEQALAIRQQVFAAFEKAELETDDVRRSILLTFVIIGGGPTGVELAGALGELTRHEMHGDFRRFDPQKARIVLIEAGPELLPAMPASLGKAARLALEQLGVEVRTHTRVINVQAKCVQLQRTKADPSEVLHAETLLWAAGVQASAFGAQLAKTTQCATDAAGRLKVNPDLSLPGYPNIFVIGDLAHCEDVSGGMVPGLAPAAMQMGDYVAQTLLQRLKSPDAAAERAALADPHAFSFQNQGSMAVIGRNRAVGNFPWFRLSGFPAWILWVLVHLMTLIQPHQRVRVFVQWAWRYCTYRSADRLITGAPANAAAHVVNTANTANAAGPCS